jgi:hypothetical protein
MATDPTDTAADLEDEAETDTRRMDDEIKTLSSILRTLRALEEPARRRVIAYLAARFTE